MSATPTETHPTEQLVRDVFRDVFDNRDFSDPYRYWTDESVDHFVALGISVRGARNLAQFFNDLFAAIPDWKLEIEHVVADDRHAVVQWTATGTFSGAQWQGIEPTGDRVALRGIDAIRLDEDGRVEENTVYYDGAEFPRQIGMLPTRDSAAERAMIAASNAARRLRRRLSRH
jgi:steroid delta-isomerase-like uncharacterized protein